MNAGSPDVARCAPSRCAAVLLLLAAGAACGQSPSPLSAPNVELFDNGTVKAIVRLSDGSIVVGGLFSTVHDPATQLDLQRSNLARFTPAGALDLNWDPATNFEVDALAAGPADVVYVGGAFTTVRGQPRAHLAKLSGASATLDASWNPSTDGTVYALAYDVASGAVYAGGDFTTINAQPRASIARIASNASLDMTWNPGATCAPSSIGGGCVATIELDGAGRAYVGGHFGTIGGQAFNAIARLPTAGTGAADPAWHPTLTATATVYAIAFGAGGTVFIGGGFNSVNGTTRFSIAKLDASAALDPNWNPNSNSAVLALAIDSGGAVIAGGNFTTIGGLPRSHLARIPASGSGAADAAWDPGPRGRGVEALVAEPTGTLQVGGQFSTIQNQLALGFARVDVAGALVPSPLVQNVAVVRAIAHANGGGTYVGGQFVRCSTLTRRNLLKLAADGSLDTAWDPSPDDTVYALALDPGGALFAGGNFRTIGGLSRSFIAKISGSGGGAVDATWDPSSGGTILALALDGAGSIYAGGTFNTIGGQNRASIAKLAATGAGAADPMWNPGVSGGSFPAVQAIAPDPSGLYVTVGGSFTTSGGQSRSNLAKLRSDGAGDASLGWNPSGADGQVYALLFDGNGSIFVGGTFNTIGGASRPRLAKLDGDFAGSVDLSWNAQGSGGVYALALGSNRDLYAGGFFTQIGGQPRQRIAKLSGTTGAADPTWDPGTDGSVLALVADPAGVLYAGGSFATVGGRFRRSLAALPAPLFADGFE